MLARYFISLPDPKAARGADPAFAFSAASADGFAQELQAALASDALFRRWQAAQEDPDAVDPGLAVVDPSAAVHGEQDDLHVDLVVTTSIPGTVLKHRLRLLAGTHWALNDVTRA